MIPIHSNPSAPHPFDMLGTPAKPAAAAQPAAKDSPDQTKLKKAAGDFESILLASMWKSMQQTFGDDGSSSDPAHGTLNDWGIEVMSSAVGKAGGLGIGNMIIQHLEPTLQNADQASPAAGTVGNIENTGNAALVPNAEAAPAKLKLT